MSIEKMERDNATVWRVRWREGGRNRSKVIGRKRDAEMFDAELRRQRRLGTIGFVDGGDETLAAFADEWWRLWVLPNLEPSTQDFYKWLRDTHVLPYLGGHRLRELSPELLERWKARMARSGVGLAAQAKALTLLQGILQRAVEWQRIPSNPARLVRRPRQHDRAVVEPLGPKSIEAMRSWFLARQRFQGAALVSVLAYAGLRPGEALGLTWGRVRERTLLVEQAASMGALKPYTKTRQKRTVKLLGPLVSDLAQYRLFCGRPNDQTLLFPKKSGKPWAKSDLHNWRRRGLEKAAEAAGVTCTPYTLRHGFASLLIWEGYPVTYVASQLGHSPAMCLSTYAHTIAELEEAEWVSAETAIRSARGEAGTPAVPFRAVAG